MWAFVDAGCVASPVETLRLEVCMKRDMDLVRAILLAAEDSNEQWLGAEALVCNAWDQVTVARHFELMDEAGLVVADVTELLDGGVDGSVRRLTWAGYDFLDNVRSESVWEDTKASIRDKVGSASFDLIKAVAVGLAMKALGL